MLDILTPRGRATVRDECRAAALIERRWPGVRYVHTDKGSEERADAKVDALLIRDGIKLRGLVLTSCRYRCSIATLRINWNDEWLLTWRKLARGALLARDLRTPLYGNMYFADYDELLWVKLHDGTRWVAPFRRERTLTQATVNGGEVVRLNAFIEMARAIEVRAGEAP